VKGYSSSGGVVVAGIKMSTDGSGQWEGECVIGAGRKRMGVL
jgi:hypothetical protein